MKDVSSTHIPHKAKQNTVVRRSRTLLGAVAFALGLQQAAPASAQVKDVVVPKMPKQKAVKPAPRPAPAVPKRRNDFVKDELLLVYNFGTKIEAVEAVTRRYGLKRKGGMALGSVRKGVVIADTQGQDVLDLQEKINQAEDQFDANTNNTYFLAATVSKPIVSNYDYPIAQTGVGRARLVTQGQGVTICMIDTGVDTGHPSLDGSNIRKVLTARDGVGSANLAHGTSIAGALVSGDDQIGIAPKASLIAIDAFSSASGNPNALRGTSDAIVAALETCIKSDADIINMSFTGGRDRFVEAVVKRAIAQGITVVAAGGNSGRLGSTVYPAAIRGVVGVTAIDRKRKRFARADRGRFIDYAAPGVKVFAPAPGGKYQFVTGTSIAAAHFSGVLALMKSEKKQYRPQDFDRTIMDLGPAGRDQLYGMGLINAAGAVRLLRESLGKKPVLR